MMGIKCDCQCVLVTLNLNMICESFEYSYACTRRLECSNGKQYECSAGYYEW